MGRVADGTRGWATRVLLAVVLLTSVTLLGTQVRRGVTSTRAVLEPTALAEANALFESFACVEAKIDRQVPPGARIDVHAPDVLWLQRAIEGSYPRDDPTTRAHAQYDVTIAGTSLACDLVTVMVRRVHRP